MAANIGNKNALGFHHSERSKKLIGDAAKIHKKGNQYTKGKKLNLTEQQRLNRSNWMRSLNARGIENRGGNTKHFIVDNVVLQGQYELYYYLTSKEKLKKSKPIKTPFGFYTPDFETDDKYIEIKSTYTALTCLRSIQIKKIKWVSNNIKFVTIKILKGQTVIKFIKTLDLEIYKY